MVKISASLPIVVPQSVCLNGKIPKVKNWLERMKNKYSENYTEFPVNRDKCSLRRIYKNIKIRKLNFKNEMLNKKNL